MFYLNGVGFLFVVIGVIAVFSLCSACIEHKNYKTSQKELFLLEKVFKMLDNIRVFLSK